jgi:hypothetical protein
MVSLTTIEDLESIPIGTKLYSRRTGNIIQITGNTFDCEVNGSVYGVKILSNSRVAIVYVNTLIKRIDDIFIIDDKTCDLLLL